MSRSAHCVIVGAGIIGISCGIELLRRGYSVELVDYNEPASMTSSGNAGGFGVTEVMPVSSPGIIWRVPGWLADPCGPLSIRWRHLGTLLPWLWRFNRMGRERQVHRISRALASLILHCGDDSKDLARFAGIHDLLEENGALTVYRSESAMQKDKLEWDIKRAHGIVVEKVDAATISSMEPALRNARAGYYTPQWFNTTDPLRFALGLARKYAALGGEITRDRVCGFDARGERVTALRCDRSGLKHADVVVIAAGVWSGELCRQLGDRVLMESERGYNMTLPRPGVRLNRQIIFGTEKFVVTRINNGLRIGGAAEFAGIHAGPNHDRSRRLVDIARTYLPDLDATDAQPWMGHRPSTPDSLPVIGPAGSYLNVYYAFGHGHLGLTMAATTARLLGQMMAAEPPLCDPAPFHVMRFRRNPEQRR